MPTKNLPPPGAAPIEIVVTRGQWVESRHAVACAVVDAGGKTLAAWGDVTTPVYPRSSAKPIQALPLVESGAADAFGLSQAELALACASHSGEPIHVEKVGAWLQRIGLAVDDLECGGHWPYHEASMQAMVSRGERPTALHNNCSGKHAGMLSTARHLGEPTRFYTRLDHPVQERVIRAISEMSGCDLGKFPTAVDGCSIPTVAIPLAALALALARFGAPAGLAPARGAACRRLAQAITADPLMISGHQRFDSTLIQASGGGVLSKGGAEGVQVMVLPERGLGIALKAADGAPRAREVAAAAVLVWLDAMDEATWTALQDFAEQPLFSRRGMPVGRVVPATAAGF